MEATTRIDPQAPSRMASGVLWRILLSSVIGTAVEWYDFAIYGFATALVFNALFFPTRGASVGSIAAFATYGVGFFARPIGAAIFGHYGDKRGRKAMLAATIIIMGVGTFLIGLLSTYGQIGIAAPVLLVCLRLLQGIGLGGEWGGAVLMVVENASTRYRGLLGSIVQIGNPVGVLAAVGIFAVVSKLPEQELMSWGWRVPFLISILLVSVGMYIRLNLAETPVFQQLKSRDEVVTVPILEILTRYRRPFFVAIGLKISEIAYYSIAGVFVISYVTGQLGLPRDLIINAVLVSSAVALLSIPAFGWLADRLGRKTLFLASCVFSIAFAFPLFRLLDTKDPAIITLAVVIAINLGQMVGFSIGAPWYSELFPARLRYSGVSLGFQIGAALSGGLTPVIAASLMAQRSGATWPISVYLIGCACITAVAAIAAPETAGKELA